MKNNKFLIGLLALTLLAGCKPNNPSSSEKTSTSSQPTSSELVNSSTTTSSETPVVEKGYKIKLGKMKLN